MRRPHNHVFATYFLLAPADCDREPGTGGMTSKIDNGGAKASLRKYPLPRTMHQSSGSQRLFMAALPGVRLGRPLQAVRDDFRNINIPKEQRKSAPFKCGPIRLLKVANILHRYR